MKTPSRLIDRVTASIPGAVIFSVLAGGIGTVILIVFFGGVLSPGTLIKFIPWALGFNAAITGYALMDKLRDRLAHPRMLAIIAGLSMVFCVCLVLIFCLGYGSLLTAWRFFLYSAIGGIFSGFGAWLAIKYHRIK